MTTLKITYKKIKDLKKYEQNARTHSIEQVQQIINSIKEFGWTNPILIDENDIIIAGHGRLNAAEMLNLDEVPCIVLTGLTEIQKRAYLIADNQLALNAGWDFELLQAEIESLKLDDFDISLLGFSDEDFNNIFGDEKEEVLEDETYTNKIQTPVYEPSENTPFISELYDSNKTKTLIKQIKSFNLPKEIESFLFSAAQRHTIFNFNKIADYYASAEPAVQELFERSALVIIDYEKAIEYGFVKLTKDMINIVHGDDDHA